MNKIKTSLIVGIIFFLPIVMATQHLISLQGYATNASDDPLAAGDVSVRMYDAPTGGALVYNSGPDFNGAINNGVYDILLGSNTPLFIAMRMI